MTVVFNKCSTSSIIVIHLQGLKYLAVKQRKNSKKLDYFFTIAETKYSEIPGCSNLVKQIRLKSSICCVQLENNQLFKTFEIFKQKPLVYFIGKRWNLLSSEQPDNNWIKNWKKWLLTKSLKNGHSKETLIVLYISSFIEYFFFENFVSSRCFVWCYILFAFLCCACMFRKFYSRLGHHR